MLRGVSVDRSRYARGGCVCRSEGSGAFCGGIRSVHQGREVPDTWLVTGGSKSVGTGLTRDRISTSFELRTSNLDAWDIACFLRISISSEGKDAFASVALKPWGSVSNAFCSSVERIEGFLFIGLPSIRFFGLPLSMTDCPPSDSPLR